MSLIGISAIFDVFIGFDSILVRLKGQTIPPITLIISFRFHTGSIKRKHVKNCIYLTNSFDSILVRLKAYDKDNYYKMTLTGFDSILVRLKVGSVGIERLNAMFRFHTGSIKSPLNLRRSYARTVFRFHTGSIKRMLIDTTIQNAELFRFHTGSIKRPYLLTIRVMCINVSIPYWFD